MFVVNLLIKRKLLTRVSDEELVQQRLNHWRRCHLTVYTDNRQIRNYTSR